VNLFVNFSFWRERGKEKEREREGKREREREGKRERESMVY